MNLGIQTPIPSEIPPVSDIDYLNQYLDCVRASDELNTYCDLGNRLLKAFDGLKDIIVTVQTHPGQETLDVLNELFDNDFHGTLSDETLKETGRKVMDKLSKWMDDLVEYLKKFWDRVMILITSSDKKLAWLRERVRMESPKYKIPAWTYKGVGYQKLRKAIDDSHLLDGTISSATVFDMKHDLREIEISVPEGYGAAARILDEYAKLDEMAVHWRKATDKRVEEAQAAFAKAKANNNVDAAYDQLMAANVIKTVAVKMVTHARRSIASILANCKLVPVESK